MHRSEAVEQAKKEVFSLLLNRAIHQYGLYKVIKYIATLYDVPTEDLYTWAKTQQEAIFKNLVEPQNIYQKIEIEIEEIPDVNASQKNYDIAINNINNLYKRLDAIPLITDREILVNLYKNVDNQILKKEIVKNSGLEEIYDLALKENDESLRIEAIKSIHNKVKLKSTAETSDSKKVRIEAIKKIKDPHTLQKIVIQDKDLDVRKFALTQMKSVSLLDATAILVEPDFKTHVQERISILNGSEDQLKKSVETIIQNYH